MQGTRTGLIGMAALLTLLVASSRVSGDDEAKAGVREPIDAVLDAFHTAASKADGARYFDLLTKDAVFLGTDATERWPRIEFEAFAKPYFAKGKGWTYTSTQRHVAVEADGEVAWFDELLDNEHYGTCRGSGVLRKQGADWRIAQYNLSIPVPNPLARDLVARIRAHADRPTSTATLYIVRHAEKGTGTDPDLTADGRARARQLCRVLRSAGLNRIYATEYKRTQQTVATVATHLGVRVTAYAARETQRLAATLKTDVDAKAVLVAGHSNTVPELLKHLGVEARITVDEAAFDHLFVVTLRPGDRPLFQHLRYGR